MINSPINFQALVANNTNDSIPFSKSEQFTEPLLDEQNRYAVSVTRFKCSSDNIEIFRPGTPSEYFTRVRASNDVGNSTESYDNQLPWHKDSIDPNVMNGPTKYYSKNTLIDKVTRTMYRSYSDYVKSWGAGRMMEWSSTLNYDKDHSGDVDSKTTTTLAVQLGSGYVIAHVEFEIISWRNSTDPNWDSDTPNLHYVPYSEQISVWVQTPGANPVTLTLYAGQAMDINLPGTSGKSILFTEGGYQAPQVLDFGNSARSVQCYTPQAESFYKLHGHTANNIGLWALGFNSTSNITGAMRFKFRVYAVPNTYPVSAPSLFVDETTNKINISYEENYVKNGIQFGLSPKLAAMIKFEDLMKLQFDYCRFLYPANKLSSDNNVITQSQPRSSLSSLSNIARLIVKSTKINPRGDFNSSNGNLGAASSLFDFTVNIDDQAQIGDLTYDAIYPWRTYLLSSSQPLDAVDVFVQLEYVTGELVDLTIPPNTSAVVRLSFVPI